MNLLQQVLDVLERGEVLCEVTAANMLREAIAQGAVVYQWRSVEVELPEPEVDVLCYGRNAIDGSRMMFVDWCGSFRDFGRGVTHWQPLPPAPKEQA